MKIFLSFLLSLFAFVSIGQTTTTFSTYNTNPAGAIYDFPVNEFRGVSTWQGDCGGCYPMPTPSSGTPADRYFRWPLPSIMDVNASTDTYNFNNSNSGDDCFDCEFNKAIDAGGTMAIEIHFQCSYCGGHDPTTLPTDAAQGGRAGHLMYPKSWHTAFQSDAVKDFTWSEGGYIQWSPNLNSSTFQAKWLSLHQNIMTHLATTWHQSAKTGQKVYYSQILRYVVVSGYGEVGEWTNTPYQPSGVWPGPAGSAPTVAGYDSMISKVCQAYPNYWVINQVATFDGQQLTGNTNIPIDVAWYALEVAHTNKGPLGIRNDGIGNGSQYILNWTTSNPKTFTVPTGYPGAGGTWHADTAIQNRWKYAPIVGEPCCPNFMNSGGGNNDNQYSTMDALMSLMHFSEFDDGNNFDGGTLNDATLITNWRKAASRSGYKMVLTQVVSPTAITSGTTFTITPSWSNIGLNPPYSDWSVVWELKSAPGQPAVWSDSAAASLLGFLPGGPTAISKNYTKTIAAGTYGLYVTVKDANRYYSPMPLYITQSQNTDGSYFVRNITVSAGSGLPVANAGPNQAITLPTASITLDGTGSAGTITSYAWTKVSGPNTPTIVSASSATTSVTGLIQGTYVFQLALNGGSTSTISVVVNPSIPPSATIFTTQIPVATTDNDFTGGATLIQGIELGMRFQSSVAGYITGVRFYKTTGNTGTHIGELYTNTGTRLAQATYTAESPTGWQTVSFTTPILIAANTTYVVACFSADGNYVEDNGYFNGVTVTNTNLKALSDGLNGGDAPGGDGTNTANGTYLYTATPSFPNAAYHAANYWMDVSFTIQPPGTNTVPFGHTIIFQKIP